MRRIIAALLLPFILLVDWFVIEYYRPVRKIRIGKVK